MLRKGVVCWILKSSNYSSLVRRRFTNKLAKLPWEELEKDMK